MNIRLHHRSQGLVNEPVAFYSASFGKGVGHDSHFEMAHAVASAGVPCVQVTLILYLQMRRRKSGLEPFPNLLDAVRAHGSTNLKGFTLTSR